MRDKSWILERVIRHMRLLFPLAWPTMLSRIFIITLTVVDTIIVGRYSTQELAYLNLGANSVVMVLTILLVGLLLGTLVYTANASGRGDYGECGRILRRTMPFALGAGIVFMLIALPAEGWFRILGQTDELAREGGAVMAILALGLPGLALSLMCTFFLEGLQRPKIAMVAMALANLVNIGLDYLLVFGAAGLPALGAEGSAWATSIIRTGLGLGLLAYIFSAPSLGFVREARVRLSWSAWAGQRRLGYSAAVSLGAEVLAFSALFVFAGWLGERPLAAFGIAFNITTVPFMLAVGIGSATAVRVGIARARGEHLDQAIAGWTGLGVGSASLALLTLLLIVFNREIAGLYTDDPALVPDILPLVFLAGLMLVFDGGQTIMANALRGLNEIWGPMVIQSFSYLAVMVPLAYALSLPFGRGAPGLFEATIIASIVSVVLQAAWFHRQTLKPAKVRED